MLAIRNHVKKVLQILFIMYLIPFLVSANHIISYQPVGQVIPPSVIMSPTLPPPPQPGELTLVYPFLRGDANIDGKVDISDLMAISNFINTKGSLSCKDAGDVNDDGKITTADIYSLWSWLFLGGAPPRYPYPEIGFDPTDDALGCEKYAS